ncbi:MAG: HupE/UreJ family protein [Gemmatimonadetes bacterium]|nr:HupE/UreJ family protein [Gemmatimonadota bacterium]
MTTFTVYLRLGFEHLLDLQGYDHILFLAVLCAAYTLARWRELLILVTAFTIGHSVSLAVATLRLVRVDSGIVEFLIPVTIVATAVFNLIVVQRHGPPRRRAGKAAKRGGRPSKAADTRRAERRSRYAAALLFGVIHGLGFSNFLRLALGQERDILVPLLSFNIGLELAQIVVAAVLVIAAFIAARGFSVPERAWNIVVSTAAGATAAVMAAQRWPF